MKEQAVKIKRTTIIGLKGVSPGVGTTHLGNLLSHYLGMAGHSVAFVEWNNQTTFDSILSAYDGYGVKTLDPDRFKIRQVTYFKNYSYQGLSAVRIHGYDYIIIDFAARDHPFFEEVDIPILVGQGNEWKAREVVDHVKGIHKKKQKQMLLFLNFGNKEEKRVIKRYFKGKIHPIDYHKDAFLINQKVKDNFNTLF